MNKRLIESHLINEALHDFICTNVHALLNLLNPLQKLNKTVDKASHLIVFPKLVNKFNNIGAFMLDPL